MNILIVDDSKTTVNIIKAYIVAINGYSKIFGIERLHVDSAVNVAHANKKIKEKEWDVIFLDIMLPDGLGTDLIDEIKEKSDNTYITIMTGTTTIEMAEALGIEYPDELTSVGGGLLEKIDTVMRLKRSKMMGCDDFIPKKSMNEEIIMKTIVYAIDRNEKVIRRKKIVDDIKSIIEEK